ncbi:DUF1499 domain-containing protein [Rhodobacteraceae bacterium F11138]|nr:DUF1499 domain-containing protein [Rhodobacteraceae bacterium F11138]
MAGRMTVLWVVLFVVLAGLGYIRLAPSDPAIWHDMPADTADRDFANGVIRGFPAGPDSLRRLNAIILATPRTKTLAGSVATGLVTYVTRSAVFGFPDYTTVRQFDGRVTIYARARFGRSDLGVNLARVQGWLGVLQP